MSDAATPHDPSKETIIIAEDSAPNRKILAHLLEKLGYNVIACTDGQEAFKQLQTPAGETAVAVLSDIMMPNMNGLEFLKAVREHEKFNAIPFVLITAVSDKDYIIQAKAMNVTGYILKPMTFARVTAKLTEIFPGKIFPKIAS